MKQICHDLRGVSYDYKGAVNIEKSPSKWFRGKLQTIKESLSIIRLKKELLIRNLEFWFLMMMKMAWR